MPVVRSSDCAHQARALVVAKRVWTHRQSRGRLSNRERLLLGIGTRLHALTFLQDGCSKVSEPRPTVQQRQYVTADPGDHPPSAILGERRFRFKLREDEHVMRR